MPAIVGAVLTFADHVQGVAGLSQNEQLKFSAEHYAMRFSGLSGESNAFERAGRYVWSMMKGDVLDRTGGIDGTLHGIDQGMRNGLLPLAVGTCSCGGWGATWRGRSCSTTRRLGGLARYGRASMARASRVRSGAKVDVTWRGCGGACSATRCPVAIATAPARRVPGRGAVRSIEAMDHWRTPLRLLAGSSCVPRTR